MMSQRPFRNIGNPSFPSRVQSRCQPILSPQCEIDGGPWVKARTLGWARAGSSSHNLTNHLTAKLAQLPVTPCMQVSQIRVVQPISLADVMTYYALC
jgi:hypothetical protein